MFRFTRPSEAAIRTFLEAQARLELSYPDVEATANQPPAGYTVDRTRVRLGAGQAVFHAAQAALRRWEQFHLGWVELCWPQTPLEPGQVVGLLAHFFGLWSLNACRVVYAVQEPRRFGLAYGTLPEHAESGEERFTVTWEEVDDAVYYDILAFSRPNGLLSRLGYPLARRLQRRFARDSAAAMLRAVGAS
jgi:uncharacterized protein (UPF0548 family)